uniref:Arylsulfatase B-like n=2 Tax=Ciona intestinalis TaxID=7719 RepID=F6TLU2_CIOIN
SWPSHTLCFLVFVQVLYVSGHQKPNILLIVADDLGFNDVGYHNPDIYTPNINKLAKDGVILESYYVQPICTPSRSQLMTGRYQIHTGLQHSVIFAPQPNCLPVDEIILPQKLKEAGYTTHAVGKWHLGFYKKECLPTSRGFDTFYGYYCGAEDYYTKQVHANFHFGNKTRRVSGFDFHDNSRTEWEANGTYSSYLYRDRAVRIIKSHNSSIPLFMYLPFQSVHFPLQVPAKYIKRYRHIKDRKRRTFSAMVTAMDEAIGSVVDALKWKGIWQDTLVVFTTDNGGQTLFGGNNWPLRGRKASLWEGGVRGVGLVRGYGIRDKGRSSNELVHISDWFPTLLYIAGANASGTKPLDSYNVWDAIANKDVVSPRVELLHNIDPLFTRPYTPTPKLIPYPNKHGVNTTKGHAALRYKHWKLHTGDPGYDKWDLPPTKSYCNLSGMHTNTNSKYKSTHLVPSVHLFDIENDPQERKNLAQIYPKVVDLLLGKIAMYNKSAVPINFPPYDPKSNPSLHGGVW